MKPTLKYILLAILAIIVIVGVYAYREFTRKPADLSSVSSQSSITADSLVRAFENDEQKSNSRYLGKPIDVTGNIAEIVSQKDTVVNITLGKKDDMHRVSCLIDINHIDEIKSYKAGDKIIIRGICNGYLMDVELNRCVVVK